MVHTTLSQGKHIAQEKEKSLIESKWKGQEQGILIKSKWKGQRKSLLESKWKGQRKSLFESKWKGQKQSVLSEPKCKGQEKYCRPGSKTGLLIICMYTNKPRSKDRAYDLKNQSHKTGDNTSI